MTFGDQGQGFAREFIAEFIVREVFPARVGAVETGDERVESGVAGATEPGGFVSLGRGELFAYGFHPLDELTERTYWTWANS